MDNETRMTVRLPDDIHARLRAQAEHDRRSLHAQLLVYVERGLDQDEKDHDRKGS
jgi:predicted transcriptional regulator